MCVYIYIYIYIYINISILSPLEILSNRRHSSVGHTIRHNEFVAIILEGAISGKKGCGKTSTAYLKQVARNTAADSYTEMEITACINLRWKSTNKPND